MNKSLIVHRSGVAIPTMRECRSLRLEEGLVLIRKIDDSTRHMEGPARNVSWRVGWHHTHAGQINWNRT